MRKKLQFQARQGDVFIKAVAKIPADAKVKPRDNGRVVLAYGEATGHAHAIAELGCDLLETADERFVRVLGEEIPAIRCRNVETDDVVWIPMGYDAGKYKDLVAEGPEVVKGVVLRHEEHSPFVIPNGTHQVGGTGIRTQREYSPEAIRNVED